MCEYSSFSFYVLVRCTHILHKNTNEGKMVLCYRLCVFSVVWRVVCKAWTLNYFGQRSHSSADLYRSPDTGVDLRVFVCTEKKSEFN